MSNQPYVAVAREMWPPARTCMLLLLTYYFPPVAAVAVYRWIGLSRHLQVVAPSAVKWEPDDPALVNRLLPGIEVERAPFSNSRLAGQVVP